jgi:hypothetical protein
MEQKTQVVRDQTRLPASVAFEVVLQGIRIRLGRSLITIGGVVCGIAFLMSVITGQLIRRGVREEDEIRSEVGRIDNFIRAELPPVENRVLSLILAGPPGEVEMRVLELLQRRGVKRFETLAGLPMPLPRPLERVEVVEAERFGESSAAVLLLGDGAAPAVAWSDILARGRAKALATTLEKGSLPALPADQLVLLSRKVTEEEQQAREREERRDSVRNIWILSVSLVVTVMGIANAMLMSVTERFREIGTMKCLGALSAFVRQMFLIESCLMGIVGGFIGAAAGALFSIAMYAGTYGAGPVFGALPIGTILPYGLASVAAGIALSVVAAIYPAQVASDMVPAVALRSSV